MSDSQTHNDLQAAHGAAIAAANSDYHNSLEALDRKRGELQDQHAAKLAELEAAHEAELKDRSKRFARFAHSRLAPLWGAYRKSGDRADALKLAAEVRLVEHETRQALGTLYNGRGAERAVLGDRLWTVIVASHLARNAESIGAFVNDRNLAAGAAIEEISAAMKALLDPRGTGAELALRLDELEAAVTRIGRNGNSATNGDETERLAAHTHWARPSDLDAALAEIDAARAAARKAEHEQRQVDVQRAQLGENSAELEERYGNGWARSIRETLGRLKRAADGTLQREQ